MLVVSSREFRENQKMYFDLVDQNKQVIVQRGKNKAYILIPVCDADRLSINPELLKIIRQTEKDIAAGKTTRVKDLKNIWGGLE